MTIDDSKRLVLMTFSLFLVIGLAGYSYFTFHTYKPKSLRQLEVKGLATRSLRTVPIPLNSTIISETESTYSQQYIFQSAKTEQEITEFYRSLYTHDGWELESEGMLNGVYTITFKNPEKILIVASSRNEHLAKTFVTLELRDRN